MGRAVGGDGKPAHEGAVRIDGHRDTIDLERGVSGTDAAKNEVRIANGEHLIGLGIGDAYLQRTADIRNWWKLWVRRR